MELTVRFWGLGHQEIVLLKRLANQYNGTITTIGMDTVFTVSCGSSDLLEVLTRIYNLEIYETKLQKLSS